MVFQQSLIGTQINAENVDKNQRSSALIRVLFSNAINISDETAATPAQDDANS
jgi:hypothetical protein